MNDLSFNISYHSGSFVEGNWKIATEMSMKTFIGIKALSLVEGFKFGNWDCLCRSSNPRNIKLIIEIHLLQSLAIRKRTRVGHANIRDFWALFLISGKSFQIIKIELNKQNV